MGNKYRLWTIAALAFQGGAMATATELLGSRMLAPFFGAGLEVWAAVLAATLFGFVLGYFAGARLVKVSLDRGGTSNSLLGYLWRLYLLSGAWQLFLMALAETLISIGYSAMAEHAVIPVAAGVLVPGVAFWAATSPLLVQLSAAVRTAGSATGWVVGLSTIGGAFGIFAFGFLVIPVFGVFNAQSLNAWLTIALVASLPILVPLPKPRLRLLLAAPMALLLIALPFLRGNSLPSHIQYRETGPLGELIVTNLPLEQVYGGGPRRMMLSNRIAQTAVEPKGMSSLWDYPHFIATLAGLRPVPRPAHALVLGQAGGTVALELSRVGYAVDAVDIDPRVHELGTLFFGLPSGVRHFTDDARHYLNVCDSTYNIIVYDLFAGEGQPGHVFSLEAFQRAMQLLRPGGRIIVNNHGFWMGPEGLGTRSVAHTMHEAGLHTYLMPTRGTPVERNLLLVGTRDTLPSLRWAQFRQNQCCQRIIPYPEEYVRPLLPEHYQDGYILHDDYPMLDQLNRSAYQHWRKYAIDHYLFPLREQGLHFY